MRPTPRAHLGLAAAALAGILLAACAAPTGQAAPPVTGSASPTSSSRTGPTVTVPQLSGASSSAPAESSSAAPTPASNESATTPSDGPTTPATSDDVEATDDPADDATPAAPAPAPTTAAPAPAPQTTARPAPSDGRTVVIDPGHNGANGANPDIINQQVDAGFGQRKACNTTGTSTNDGYPEHQFAWGVAQALRGELESAGITVIMTRDSDDGVGPCVDRRAATGNDAGADAVVSLHGDGADASVAGFYVLTAERAPAGSEMAGRSAALAGDIRDGLEATGLSPNNALGSNGLWQRDDLAGLNLSLRPTVLIEFGNMRNATEATFMSSPAGQRQYAQGVAQGVLAFLG